MRTTLIVIVASITGIWIGSISADIGEVLCSNKIITWWDSIYIPIVVWIMPIFLGYFIGKKSA